MSFQKIRDAVLSEATVEAARIVESARSKIAETLQGQKDQFVRESERRYSALAAAIEEEFQRKLSHFNGLAGKTILERRNGMLRTVSRKAKEAVLAWPEDRYETLMSRLIVHAADVRGGKVRIHNDDRALFLRVVSRINQERMGQGEITVDDGAFLPERGGFVFLGQNYEVDRKLETMLAQIEQELTPVIANGLFGGGAQ